MFRRLYPILLVILLFVTCAVAISAPTSSSQFIPVYPGGRVTNKVTFTDKDILPMINGFVDGLQSSMSAELKSLSANGAAGQDNPQGQMIMSVLKSAISTDAPKILKDLKQVSVVQYKTRRVSVARINEFYNRKMGLNKYWTNNITSNEGGELVQLYTKPNLDGIVMLIISKGDVVVVRTSGHIDAAAIGRTMGNLMPVALFSAFPKANPRTPDMQKQQKGNDDQPNMDKDDQPNTDQDKNEQPEDNPESTKSDNGIQPRIVVRGEMILAGATSDTSDIHGLWQKFIQKQDGIENKINTSTGYEVHQFLKTGTQCIVATEISKAGKLPEGIGVTHIPAGQYALFTHRLANGGYEGLNSVMEKWLKTGSYEKAGDFIIEVFDQRFKGGDKPDSEIDFLIPIKMKKA